MSKKVYAKIFCEEGVIFEKKFETEVEAEAFVMGFKQCIEQLDIEDDYHDCAVDDSPAHDSGVNEKGF